MVRTPFSSLANTKVKTKHICPKKKKKSDAKPQRNNSSNKQGMGCLFVCFNKLPDLDVPLRYFFLLCTLKCTHTHTREKVHKNKRVHRQRRPCFTTGNLAAWLAIFSPRPNDGGRHAFSPIYNNNF